MENRKVRNNGALAKLEMTPMIDVVFQLLIFFVVTLKEQDILSQLNISRPMHDSEKPTPRIDLLTIEIGRDGWVLNGHPFVGLNGFTQLDRQLTRLASFNQGASIIIKCAANSPHTHLIRVLNVLSRENMQNISVHSL